jgi:ABC-type multidrug transport system ATPase subunit
MALELVSPSLLEIDGLGKRYGDFSAIRDLNLRVARAELFAQVGSNGAGKTTTVRILMGSLQLLGELVARDASVILDDGERAGRQ